MKKYLLLFILSVVTIIATAQERTITLNNGNALDLTTTRWIAYNWSSTLDNFVPTTRDTIDLVVLVKNQSNAPLNFYASLTFAPVTTADTTIAITVQEKMFESGTYADLIASALTGAITTTTIVNKTTLGVTVQQTNTTASAVDLLRQTVIANNDTLTVAARTQTVQANPLLYYRYLKFRMILQGNDHTGTGIKLNRFEIQFFN